MEAPIDAPYSLTEIITVTASPSSLTSLDAMIVDAAEPGSVSLLGTALLALTIFGRRPSPAHRALS